MRIEEYPAVEVEDLKQENEDDRRIEPVASIYRFTEDNSQKLHMVFNKNEDLSEILFLLVDGFKEIREAVMDAMTAYLASMPEMDCRSQLAFMDAAQAMIRNKIAWKDRSAGNVDWKLMN